MTKQELQQALKDRGLANQEKEQALQENEVLKKGLEMIDSTISKLKKEQAKASLPPSMWNAVKPAVKPSALPSSS